MVEELITTRDDAARINEFKQIKVQDEVCHIQNNDKSNRLNGGQMNQCQKANASKIPLCWHDMKDMSLPGGSEFQSLYNNPVKVKW